MTHFQSIRCVDTLPEGLRLVEGVFLPATEGYVRKNIRIADCQRYVYNIHRNISIPCIRDLARPGSD